MRALLFTNLFPSQYQPTRGVYNLRGFGALASFCDVEIVRTRYVLVACPPASRLGAPRSRASQRPLNELSDVLERTSNRDAGASGSDVQFRQRTRARIEPATAVRRYFRGVRVSIFGRRCKARPWLNLPLVAFVLGSDMNELAQRPELGDRSSFSPAGQFGVCRERGAQVACLRAGDFARSNR